jgi:hypothetical protein
MQGQDLSVLWWWGVSTSPACGDSGLFYDTEQLSGKSLPFQLNTPFGLLLHTAASHNSKFHGPLRKEESVYFFLLNRQKYKIT